MDLIKSWWEEKRSAYLYSVLVKQESHPLRKKLFAGLETAANEQAMILEEKIKQNGQPVPSFKLNARTHIVVWLLKNISIKKARYILSAMKIRGMSVFTQDQHEKRHQGMSVASNLRAAVFGVNDGLVSNVSLILGIAAANANPSFIVLAGVAGLLAGASSMAAGEYISVRSQREIFEYQIALERDELTNYPEEEAEELSLIYQARGIPKDDADKLGKLMINNPDTALDTLAREELGLNPSDLTSPIGAMISSFFSFALGAGVPLLPFLVNDSPYNIYISVALTLVMLFFVGTITSLFTNQNAMKSGLRMLLIGCIAGLITYGVGKLLGIAL